MCKIGGIFTLCLHIKGDNSMFTNWNEYEKKKVKQ